MSSSTITKTNRIVSIDALRGFALAGIVVVHMVEQYTASMIPDDWQAAKNATLIDQIIEGAMFLLIRGKFFALFSLLFGLSYFIQMDKAAKKGIRFEGRFLWRLIILFVIGCFHQMFYSGDILTIYAVVGFIILPFYRINNKLILLTSFIFLLGLARFLSYAITGVDDFFPLTGRGDEEYWDILKTGSLTDVFQINLFERMIAKVNFQLGFIGRGGLTLGFFLLGLWIGKTRIIQTFEDNKNRLKKIMYWSLAGMVFFLFVTGILFFLHGQQESLDSWAAMGGLTALDQFNLCFTFVIAIGFLLLFHKKSWHRFLMSFAPYGRMALTNYVFQSIIGTSILFGWGLGYVGEIRNIWMFLISIAVIIFQMKISKWWLQKFNYGPLEWLWRSATYLKWQPFKRHA